MYISLYAGTLLGKSSSSYTNSFQQVPWSHRFLLEIFLRVIENETLGEVKTSCKATSKRKTSGYLALESHFHGNYRVRVCRPSDADWLIILQTPKSIWLVRIIWTNDGTMRISLAVVRFLGKFCLSLYQRKNLFFQNIIRAVVAQSLKRVKRFAANNTGSCCVRLQVALEENFNLVVATSLYRFAQLVLFHMEKTFKKNLWDKGIQQATSKH